MEGRRVLLVEDDDNLRGLVRRHLVGRGWQVAEARTVGEAIAALEEERPDLLVLDLNLPDGNGWEVALRVRSSPGPRVPILVCSACAPPAGGARACGIEGYLTKPFRIATLEQAVDSALTARGEPGAPLSVPAGPDGGDAAFYSSLAHDARTPMASLRTAVESLLADDVEWDEAVKREFLELIAASGERVSRYARDVIDMARLDAGAMRCDPRPVDPGEATESALRSLDCSGAPTRRVEVRVDPEAAPAQADPAHLHRILEALLENALQFALEGPVWVDASASDGMVIWRVADGGPGIPPEDEERVFDKHYRIGDGRPRVSRGPRLSLHICAGLARLQGGRMWVETTEGGGARFCLALPTAPPPREGN